MKAPRIPLSQPGCRFFCRLLGLALLLSQAVGVGHAAGTVVAWGANDSFQSSVPLNLSNIIAVAGGISHSLALKGNGTVIAWGYNVSGQTNVPAGLSGVSAIAAGESYSMALKSNGTVVVWGAQATPPADLTNAIAIAGGWTHSVALRSDGTVVSWGSQTAVPGDLTNAVAVAAGNGQSLALRSDGTVTAWGDNSFGKATVPGGLSTVTAIAAGGDHCLALKRNGTIVAWGRNNAGQTTVPSGLTFAVAISAGAAHSIALKPDSTLIAWGDNTYGQTTISSGDSGYAAVAAGGYHNLAIKGDGFPYILVQPFSQSVLISQNVTFQVVAIGEQPLTYQWRKNGTNTIGGATSSSYTIPNVQLSDGGFYSVVVGNRFAQVASAAAQLMPLTSPPVIVTPPTDATTICGDSASFQVSAAGTSPLSYQWQFNGAPLPGATRTGLSLPVVTASDAGLYSIVVTNLYGAVTSSATLTVLVAPPQITSALTASGTQGTPFTYTIRALHTPVSFGALFLPNGLSLNPASGLISGTPTEFGVFDSLITANNSCSSDTELFVITISSSLPVITSAGAVTGIEGTVINPYQITATHAPNSFGAQNLPIGIFLNPTTGLITGTPVYAGDYFATIWATNIWGAGSATLHFTFSPKQVAGLSIGNFSYAYSSPYLLDFSFTLRDDSIPATAEGLVTDPGLFALSCFEDGNLISASETGATFSRASDKLTKTYLVLDFTESVSLVAGAVSNMVAGSQYFVDQQAPGSQVGAYEFHREDMDPQQVIALTSKKSDVDQALAGILTNYVKGFPAASRCWDAVDAAVKALGSNVPDEQHFVIFVSDGFDESSTNTVTQVITDATNNAVQIYCIGFGQTVNFSVLGTITSQTGGRLYGAASPTDIYQQFSLATKDFQARYILRWATLKRTPIPFMPSFTLFYQASSVDSPPNPVTPAQTNIDGTTTPPTTNITPASTNFIIGYYYPVSNGPPAAVTVGTLRLSPDSEVSPTSMTLRASYIPRYIRQLRFHFQPNWPCTVTMLSTNRVTYPGTPPVTTRQMLNGWSMTSSNDLDGSTWLLLSSSNTANLATSLPFAGFGPLLSFAFRDVINPSNAFSSFSIDNTLYNDTGGQSFRFTNTSSYISSFPLLAYHTPVPWLIQHGYPNSSDWGPAETADPDGDGALNWQEYVANTDPRDANSKFVIRQTSRLPDGRFQLTFSTSTNRLYDVQSSTDLTSMNWSTAVAKIPGINSDVTIIDTRPLNNPQTIYYRVQVY